MKAYIAACQPWSAISFCAMGATRKVPKEPMPATMPSVALRRAGETTREVAVSDRLEAVQESDMPISTPVPSKQRDCAGREHGHHETGGEADAAQHQHDAHAETIGDRADERLGDAPDHVLQREGKGEIGNGEAEIAGDRHHEKAEALSHAHAETHKQRSGRDNRHALRPSRG